MKVMIVYLLEAGPQIFGSRADTFFALVRYWVCAAIPTRKTYPRAGPMRGIQCQTQVGPMSEKFSKFQNLIF